MEFTDPGGGGCAQADAREHQVVDAGDEESLVHRMLLEVFEDGSGDEAVVFEDFFEDPNSADKVARATACSEWIWRSGSCEPHTVDFSENPGPTNHVTLTATSSSLNFLKQFFSADMLESIATETNRYAEYILKTATCSSSSKLHMWKPTSINELWSFLGLIIGMKFVPVDNLSLYWSKDALYNFPFFRSVMSGSRFFLLLKFLHITNTMNPKNKGDVLSKVMPFLNHILVNFQDSYTPRQNLALGESFIFWKATQSSNNSENKSYGIKVYELIDTYNGYCCGFHVCYTKKSSMSPGIPSSVVMNLMRPYFNKGHRLYIGTYCDSPTLYQDLEENGVLACGPVEAKLSGLGLISKIKFTKDGDFRVAHYNKINHVKVLVQGKEMNFLTTIHARSYVRSNLGSTSSLNSSSFPKNVVEDYNKYMNILDQYDLTTEDNTFKNGRYKHWKKVFCQFFTLALTNAYLLYCDLVMAKGEQPLSKRTFHENLVKEMCTLCLPSQNRKRGSVPEVDDLSRLTERHFLSKVPVNEEYQPQEKKRKYKPKPCAVCHGLACTKDNATKPYRRREVIFECRECGVGLCPIPCFKLYHTERNYKGAFLQLAQDNAADEEHDADHQN
ncbi:PiggyBac transposable element-derived protein 4-like [Elysia marginata]|uniref:PiggyBac transposable element-derived protein 4-like n=1 Tax=Elysia marginata TaxID=1093978 RepID=A0AAV4GZL1_9GAST|nr:PiggyBac transposable element-derived protein 4-like [Elysia marginata]